MTSKSVEIAPAFHRQGNGIPSAAIRWPDSGDWPSSGGPLREFSAIQTDPSCRFHLAIDFPGPFAAMTALRPIASRSPGRTGLCRAGRSAPSQCEMVTGPGFSSPNQPNQERTTVYRDSSGQNSRSDSHYATILCDWKKPSGKSQLIWVMSADTFRILLRS